MKCCKGGFHFCENPLDVFSYYDPANSRYCEVEGSGKCDKDDDTKVSVSNLHVGLEIGLNGLVNAGVKFILNKVKLNNCEATNTGDYSAANVEGKDSIAIVTGRKSKAAGALGCWLVLTERDDNMNIINVKAIKVDGEKIKANIFYMLKDGEIKEAEQQ